MLSVNVQVKQTILLSIVLMKNMYFLIELITDRYYNENNADVFLVLTGYWFVEFGLVVYMMCGFFDSKKFTNSSILFNFMFLIIGGVVSRCNLFSLRILFLNIITFMVYEYSYCIFNLLNKRLYRVKEGDFKYDTTSCSICLDDFDKSECKSLRRFKCFHIYHTQCIESYQKVSNNMSCPLCRV